MSWYCVNKNAQDNGDHEVHKEGCKFFPAPENRIYLGKFSSCHAAVVKARDYYSQVNGCYFCSGPCHTG